MNKLVPTLLVMGFSTAAVAATPPASSVSPLSPIYACAEKSDPVARLACFDTAVAAIKGAEARSEIVTMDQPRVAAVRREAFGFRIPSLPRFGFGVVAPVTASAGASATASVAGATGVASATALPLQTRDEIEEAQTFSVIRIGQAGNRVAIYLENGGVWQLTDAGDLNAPSQRPFNVRIRAAALGSYMLTVEGRNKGYRVRRTQ